MIYDHKTKYSYKDVSIIPSVTTDISSRQECNPYVNEGYFLPIFTAPMDSVVGVGNVEEWLDNRIMPIIPRNIPFNIRQEYLEYKHWTALSLSEFEDLFLGKNALPVDECYKALIDVANGHMECILSLSRQAKNKYGTSLCIMAGNIANPDTYKAYCEAGIDYVRCSIGSGSSCLTTSNCAVHYPVASLLDEINKIRKSNTGFKTKVIADGGIKNYSDAIKALGLGADYVMIGGLFAGLFESAAKINGLTVIPKKWESFINNEEMVKYLGKYPFEEEDKREWIRTNAEYLTKTYHGMSTKEAQKAINPDAVKFKTAEGKSVTVPVTGTICQWAENFTDYLRSAMSYTGKRTLTEFCGNVDFVVNSHGVSETVNK